MPSPSSVKKVLIVTGGSRGVSHGIIHTDIHAGGGDPDRVERMKGVVPMKRGGTAEEVASDAWRR